MTGTQFHIKDNAKRRGDSPPGRSRFGSRRGVTLVELMIAMLILTLVCVAWLEIIGIQSARKEARRREAVERLAGMMDAFMYMGRSGEIAGKRIRANKYNYVMVRNENNKCEFETRDLKLERVERLFDEINKDGFNVSPIGYQLLVVDRDDLEEADKFGDNWGSCKWLVGKLYNHSDCSKSEAGTPFFVLPVCLGL